MTLQQLRYFLALCEEKSFTRAAQRCGVSQPSLSAAIAALEDELGGALFSRKPRGQLTKLGKTFYPVIQSAVRKLDDVTRFAARQRTRNTDVRRNVRLRSTRGHDQRMESRAQR